MNKLIFTGILSVIFFSALAKIASAHTYTVIYVLDGDTLYVKNDTDATRFKLRIICADAAEKSQPKWGQVAIDRMTQLAPPNSKLTITNPSIDMYGRTLGYVYSSNKLESLSETMVKEGLAIWYKWQAGCDIFQTYETDARNNNRGFWPDYKSGTFLLPNEYKKLQSTAV